MIQLGPMEIETKSGVAFVANGKPSKFQVNKLHSKMFKISLEAPPPNSW